MSALFPDDTDDPLLSPGFYQTSAAMKMGPICPIKNAVVTEMVVRGRLRFRIYIIGRGYVVTNWFGKIIRFTYSLGASTWRSENSAYRWIKRHKHSN